MAVSKERVKTIAEYYDSHGKNKTIDAFEIPEETLNRYLRRYKQNGGQLDDVMGRIRDKFSDVDLERLLKADMTITRRPSRNISFEGEDFCFLVMSDTHIGSQYFDERYLFSAFEEGHKQGCTALLHGGDLIEGMSNRPGHIYELTKIGYAEQRNYAVELFQQWQKPMYFIIGNHDCHSSDTECLTKRGWLKYNELTYEDFVYSYDVEKDKGKWMPLTNIIIKEYEGDMYEFDFSTIKQTVTPNHRMLCSFYDRKKENEFTYFTAQELMEASYHKHYSFKVSAHVSNQEYPISDGMLKTITWILTDGSFYQQGNSKGYRIHQSKELDAVVSCLTEADLRYSVYKRERNITEICGKILKKPSLPEHVFSINAESSREIIKHLHNKEIPEWMLELSNRQFEIVAGVLLLANGSATNKDKSRLAAFGLHGRKEALDKWQVLFSLHGYSTRLRQDIRGASVLDVCKRTDTCVVIGQKRKKVPYKGIVWCITTPLTNFMIRKDGRASFTGNCWFNTKSSVGLDVGEDIEHRIEDAHYLGIHEGNIDVCGAQFMLWHGEDGSSYATSYRVQKIIEAFTGGEKPKVLLCAHTHKALYLQERNVHAVSTGSIQQQSGFMRYKRLPAHCGFWIIRGKIRDGSVVSFTPTWYPFYKE